MKLRKPGSGRFAEDLTGKTFGRWTVLSRAENHGYQAYWNCRCECGTEKSVCATALRTGGSKSCGCLRDECARARTGPLHYGWKGGKTLKREYAKVKVAPGKYRKEHRVVMEQKLGRPLLPGETVHHKNGVRKDNHPDNLELRVGAHPQGLSVSEAILWAKEILSRYVTEV
jgi:HNH endonuclease